MLQGSNHLKKGTNTSFWGKCFPWVACTEFLICFLLCATKFPATEGLRSLVLTLLRQTHTGESSGGISSNARDMAKWVQFHLNQGRTGAGEDFLLPAWALNHIYTPNMYSGGGWTKPKYPVSHVRMFYGMGWRTMLYRGMCDHAGSFPFWGQLFNAQQRNYRQSRLCRIQAWVPPGFPDSWETKGSLHHLKFLKELHLGLMRRK